jgi:hypothetical protein
MLTSLQDRVKKRLPSGARIWANALVRRFGMATSSLRPLPDFLIIGAKRGGTTSLYNYLVDHPCVVPLFPRVQNKKGVRFFDTNFQRGVAWYRSHFPSRLYRGWHEQRIGHPTVAGEASPYYLFHPSAPSRAASIIPDARLIVLLRDPIDRAYSHYRERSRHGAEELTFEEALEREQERLAGEEERLSTDDRYYSFAHEHFGYVSQGLYLEALRRWIDLFGRNRLLILRSEDFFASPERTYGDVLRFLGLPPWRLPAYPRFNYHEGRSMSPSTRARLGERFGPENRRLAEFLGMDLFWGP